MAILFLIAGQLIRCAVPEKTRMSKLTLTYQIMLGYVNFGGGYRVPLINALILICFQVPLGIAMKAAINSGYIQEYDSFAIFPQDPFPSRTICFTYFSKMEQEQRWINRTDYLSESCNFTYNVVPCYAEHRENIITWLAFMIAIMSALPLLIMIVRIVMKVVKEKTLSKEKKEIVEARKREREEREMYVIVSN